MYKINCSVLDELDIHAVNRFSEKGLELQTVKNKKLAFFKEMVFRILFLKNVTSCTDHKGDNICFLKDKTLGWNHSTAYNNAYKSAGKSCWKIEYETIVNFDLIRTLCLLKFIICDMKKYVEKEKGPLQWSLVCSFIIVIDFFNDVKKYNFNGTKLGVVYCDAAPIDHLFVHYLKCKGVKTATLQHGVSAAPADINNTYCDPRGIIFMNSNADYYLAMNPFSRDEAIKSGMPEEKIKITGILQYAYCDIEVDEKKKTDIFGVVLPGKGPELNETAGIKLIEYANFLASKLEKKFYIKYHPSFTKYQYDEICDKKYFMGHLPLETSVLEYSRLVDFTLISTSTVLMELVFLHSPVYHMCIEEKFDPYSNMAINSFKTQEELLRLVQASEDMQNQLFEYLCYTEKPEEKYEEFFAEFR